MAKRKKVIKSKAKVAKMVGIDPDLRKRRLHTLVRLLDSEAAKGKIRKGELTPSEMREWSKQVTNLIAGLND